MLTDKHGRIHDYLRISLIERCNLRCQYCMPEEGIPLREKSHFMTQEELFSIVDEFVDLGVKKIRLTGGEPLIKKNFAAILKHMSSLNVELAITTNGILLDRYWDELEKANLQQLNISIDSLQKERFNEISRRDYFDRVMQNIETAISKNFNVKLNAVLMKGFNEDEIVDFVNFTKDKDVSFRFIEFMPFDGNEWNWSKTVSYESILSQLRFEFGDQLKALPLQKNATARNFQISGFQGSFGIISSVTNPFCDTCNRIRLTADGKIKNCLFSNNELDLLAAHRNGESIESIIRESISKKHAERAGLKAFDDRDFSSDNRSMVSIGG